jgi:hypothetical protein
MSDPANHTDGLASLQALRTAGKKGRTRTIPRSQNPTTLPPYKGPKEPVDVDLPREEAGDVATAENAPAAAAAGKPQPAPKQESRKVGLYIDEAHEDFLEEVRIAGNALRPKVNLSGSAVVRLALDRLMAEMSVTQVRDALVSKPIDPSAVGRRRR